MAEFVTCPPLDPDLIPSGALVANSNQIVLQENLELPCPKPDIGNLLGVQIVDVVINRQFVVPTPTTTTPGGLVFTGAKLCIEGVVNQVITYISDCSNQQLHAFEASVPFSAFIVLPATFVIGGVTVPTITLNSNLFRVSHLVECCVAQKTSPRTVFKNIVLFLYANLLIA